MDDVSAIEELIAKVRKQKTDQAANKKQNASNGNAMTTETQVTTGATSPN